MMEELSIPTPKIQQMVIRGLSDVFSTMLNRPLKFVSANSYGEDQDGSDVFRNCDEALVVGNVGFVGDISGMVYLAMPERASIAIAKRMLGMAEEELTSEHEMVNDVIGELTNMSAGGFKNQLCDAGFGCRLTIPSIIRGKYFVVEAAKTSFRQLFVFRYEDFPITVELLMKETD